MGWFRRVLVAGIIFIETCASAAQTAPAQTPRVPRAQTPRVQTPRVQTNDVVIEVGKTRRIPQRRFLTAHSLNERIVLVERDALTGELSVRAVAPGAADLVLERTEHPVPLRLRVRVTERTVSASARSRGEAKNKARRLFSPQLILPGW